MRRLGNYDIHDRLGEGGMGIVYRARDRASGESVALKLLHPEFQQDEHRRARFLREGQYARTVDHSGVVAVRDIGEVHLEHGDRTLFLCMELVPGRDLLQLLSRETLDQRWVVRVAAALGAALAAINEASLVHRDVKPGNLLVTTCGSVKLLDFGLALHLDREGLEPTSTKIEGGSSRESEAMLTQFGSVVGTPGYAAPEQLRGALVDSRADLYAMGATIYQMLTGALPFSGVNAKEILDAIDSANSKAEQRGVAGTSVIVELLVAQAPGVSLRLAHLVAALLSPEVASRPDSAELVAHALGELLETDDELDRPLDAPSPVTKGRLAESSAWMRLKDWWNA